MGFLSGALGAIGEQVRQKTLLDQSVEHEANQALAQNLFQLGDQAMKEKPENAPDFYKAAYAIQTTPLGKKPPKWATDIQGMLFKHRQAEYAPQMQEPPGPPQHGNMPDVPLDPNNPDVGTLDSSFAAVHQDLIKQAQQEQQQKQIEQAQQSLQVQQQAAQAPPPVSGLPSPGFSSIMPHPPGSGSIPFPTLPGMPGGTSGFAGPVRFPGNTEFALLTPQEKAQQAQMADVQAKQNLVNFAHSLGLTDPHEIANFINKQALATGKSEDMVKVGKGETLVDHKGHVIYSNPSSDSTSDTKEVNGVLFERPPNAPPGTPWLPVTPTSGASVKLTESQQAANASYEATRQLTDPNYKITAADYPKAKAWFDEQAMTPEQLQQRRLAVESAAELKAQRQLAQMNTQLHIQEFKATHGQDAIDGIVKQMQADPDVFFAKDMDAGTRQQVARAWTQQTGMPPPRELPSPLKTKEGNSVIALNAVSRLKKMLAENPVIQKRMGAWDGRVGDLEQTVGSTVGLSPQDAQAIQNFRSSVNYLFFQEGQAILQRSPQQLMAELQKTSPSMKQGLPLFLGAIEAVKGTAQNNIQSANDYRFNRATGSGNMPAPPAAVNPFR